ncbi:molybdopterin molybdotransferase MoeA [Botrimarina sp.]|uniref:molybdopterin molybdotransferase MoeA n=1 Tax=Botrimarina sp. TaxID=2795802 RepID=UPI0032ED4DFE
MSCPPDEALRSLLRQIEPVAAERVPLRGPIAGRVLAEPVVLDRDSPACDVSAMDGFVAASADLATGPLPIDGECLIGQPPAPLPRGVARRIYTGCPIPEGADTVLRLEHASVVDGRVALGVGHHSPPAGADIRCRGENGRAGAQLTPAGVELGAAVMTALATVGPADVAVHRRLTVAVMTTGNELTSDAPPTADGLPPWRVRDSNGPALQALLSPVPWVHAVQLHHAADKLDDLTNRLREAIEGADAVVLTGGVSKGAYDFVPEAAARVGAEEAFHRIAARPGQPTFAAIAHGKPILGLPGNPLSVLCTGRRLLTPALRRRAGVAECDPAAPTVTVSNWGDKALPLTWWRPVRLTSPGAATIAASRGSGDVCGAATTDGFIQAPPESSGPGPYPFYSWRI